MRTLVEYYEEGSAQARWKASVEFGEEKLASTYAAYGDSPLAAMSRLVTYVADDLMRLRQKAREL